jgi:hypothetical protein
MKKFMETIITTSIFYLKLKESHENDMAAHGSYFDFYYRPKPRQTGQNGCPAFVDTHLAIHQYFIVTFCFTVIVSLST